jgi:hypothetical protein
MRFKHKKQPKTAKRVPGMEEDLYKSVKSVILNPELEKHRQAFLGKPGSKLWKDYYEGLIETKRRLFSEEPIYEQPQGQGTKRKTLKKQLGGIVETAAVAAAIAASIQNQNDGKGTDGAVAAAIAASRDNANDKTGVNANRTGANGNANGTGAANGNNTNGTGAANGNNTNGTGDTNGNANTSITLNRKDCKIPYGWLVDLFETPEMKDLLVFARDQVKAKNIELPYAWTDGDPKFDVTTILETVIKNPKKGPCKAEDIKTQYIPFILKVYMLLVESLKPSTTVKPQSSVDAKASSQIVETKTPEKVESVPVSKVVAKPKDATNTNALGTTGKSTEQDEDEDEDDPVFIAAAAADWNNINDGNNLYNKSIPSLSEQELTDDSAILKLSNSSSNHEDEIKPKLKSIIQKDVTEREDTFADEMRELNKLTVGGENPPEPVDPDAVSAKNRERLLFTISLLRNMNMYSNPMFFDDLYYYYYFLSLDKIIPNMDDFFRMFDPPDPPPPKKDAKVNVQMRMYQQFPNDDPRQEAQEDKHYGFEMSEKHIGANPESDFDLFLNLVQLHPDFDYKITPKAVASKTFSFEEKIIEENKPTGPSNVEMKVLDDAPPTTKGGGLFGPIYSVLGLNSYGLYHYLDDSPLARDFESLFKDEDATFDGNIHLCLYSLDKSCNFDGNGPTPFLKFITNKTGDKWGFPSFHYKSLHDPEQNDASFKCEMFNAVMNLLEIHLCDNIVGGGEENNQPKTENDSTNNAAKQPPVDNAAEPSPVEDAEPSLPVETSSEQQPVDNPVEPSLPVETSSEQQPVDNPVEPSLPVETPSEQPPLDNAAEPSLPVEDTEQQPPVDNATEPPVETPKPENEAEPQSVTPVANISTEQPPPVDNAEQPQSVTPVANISTEQQVQESSPLLPINVANDCNQIESSLDSMYIGLVTEEINGTRHIFAFLNYDFLENVVQTPENKAQNGLLFCRNADTQIYPINDTNQASKLKWAIVDELLFEKKILMEEVEEYIFDVFSKHDNLWNIEDSNQNNIDFPFSVYALQKSENEVFQSVNATLEESEKFVSNGEIGNYGSSETMEDEYDKRYCFTLTPIKNEKEPTEAKPLRYAMFAWNVRYIVTDEQVQSLAQTDTNEEQGNPEEKQEKQENKSLTEVPNTEPTEELNEQEKDEIENKKPLLPTLYTITKNKSTNDVPLVTWGILEKTQFIHL